MNSGKNNGKRHRSYTKAAAMWLTLASMSGAIGPKPKRLIPVSLNSDALPDKDNQMFGVPLVGSVQKGERNAAVSDLRSFLLHRSERICTTSRHQPRPRSTARGSQRISLGAHYRYVKSCIRLRSAALSFGRNLGSHLVYCISLQEFHRCQVSQCRM